MINWCSCNQVFDLAIHKFQFFIFYIFHLHCNKFVCIQKSVIVSSCHFQVKCNSNKAEWILHSFRSKKFDHLKQLQNILPEINLFANNCRKRQFKLRIKFSSITKFQIINYFISSEIQAWKKRANCSHPVFFINKSKLRGIFVIRPVLQFKNNWMKLKSISDWWKHI